MQKVMVFGVFDGIHEGHRFLFQQARQQGDCLVVVATPDHIVEQLKKHLPQISLQERIKLLQKENFVDEVVAGDQTIGEWGVIAKHKPAIVACGYDQHALKESLENYLAKTNLRLKVVQMAAFQPHRCHNSILQGLSIC